MHETLRERVIRLLLAVCAWSAVLSLGVITVFIFQAGLPLVFKIGLRDFLFNANWDPTAKSPSFGIFSMIVGSLWLTFGALLVGVPLGIAVTIFMTDLAPPPLVAVRRPAVQLLAGIPSVIYGFVGLTTLAPLVRNVFGGPGLSVLTGALILGALILGVMILPTVISISEDAVRTVPPALRQGARALGATRWQMLVGVVLPAARSGIVASVILAMGRALGETMAVIMMIGNSLRTPAQFSMQRRHSLQTSGLKWPTPAAPTARHCLQPAPYSSCLSWG